VRNYVWELKQLGYTYKGIAAELGTSSRTISQIGSAKARAGALYEPIRNLHRTAISQKLGEAGIKGEFRSAARRMPFEDFIQLPDQISKLAGELKDKWNLGYYNFKDDPEGWRIKFPKRKDPKLFTQNEVEARVKKALSHKKKLDKSLDPDAEYWTKRKAKAPKIIQHEKYPKPKKSHKKKA